ncbi:MAG TPA: energy transducer TonB, partial [Blastocatellia bacterium]
VFNYGTSGRLESEDAYFDDGSKEETQYDYDSNGRLLKRTSKKDRDSKSITQIMSYDSGPMETGISQYEPCPELGWTSTVSYEFDSHGNWIKRKESTRSIAPAHSPIEVQRLVERTITYYSPETGQGVPIPGETPSDALEPTFDGPPKVIRKSGGALTASATKKVQPKYPASARAAHITGAVVVEITIGEDGNVVKAVALSGPDELRDAAVVAAKAWTFAPTRLSGVPVRVIGIITFNFQM